MLQQIAAEAILDNLSYNAAGSCASVHYATEDVLHCTNTSPLYKNTVSSLMTQKYRDFTGARDDRHGFHCIPEREWDAMRLQERKKFRVDMLYYFWMASQEM